MESLTVVQMIAGNDRAWGIFEWGVGALAATGGKLRDATKNRTWVMETIYFKREHPTPKSRRKRGRTFVYHRSQR